MKLLILLNNNLNFLFLKKNNNKYILIYNKNNNIYIKYKLNINIKLYYIKNLKYILIELNYFSQEFLYNFNCINKLIDNQIKCINFYFTKKIIFFGKGFKIKKLKKKNIINLYFNKSHINFLKWNNIIIKKLKKSKILINSVNFNNIIKITNNIINCRGLNIFTKKGLRLSRQIIYKKIGKKTS